MTNRIALLLIILTLLSGNVSAQTNGGLISGNISGGNIVSSVPFDLQGGIISNDPYTNQGMPMTGNSYDSLGTVIINNTPDSLGYDPVTGKPYGPNNPPPVVNLSRRNRRDNGVVKAQELPEPQKLLDALSRQLQIWSPESVYLDSLTPSAVIKMILPFGIDTRFLCRTNNTPASQPTSGRVLPSSEPAYAVGILCWNIPIGRKRIFNPAGDLLIPRIGYGYQQERGELLAALAMANVSSSYEVRSSATSSLTVKDLMESEMNRMTFCEDLSMLSVGLAFYLPNIDRTWVDAVGNERNLIALAEYELNRPVYWNRSESINRLIGLTFLSNRFRREIKTGNIDPRLKEITNKIDTYLQTVHRRTLAGLNDAGLRETRFLSSEKIQSAADMLLVNGHILRWQLMISDRHPINSQMLRKSIYHLALTLAQFYNPRTDRLETLSPKEIEAVSVSLSAIQLYIKKYTREEETEMPQDSQ